MYLSPTPQETNRKIRLASDETIRVTKLLEACDEALTACQRANNDKAEVIGNQANQIDSQAKRIGELESEKNGILNSTLLWFVVGAIVGGVTFSLIK